VEQLEPQSKGQYYATRRVGQDIAVDLGPDMSFATAAMISALLPEWVLGPHLLPCATPSRFRDLKGASIQFAHLAYAMPWLQGTSAPFSDFIMVGRWGQNRNVSPKIGRTAKTDQEGICQKKKKSNPNLIKPLDHRK
jgi:hypothetical protein